MHTLSKEGRDLIFRIIVIGHEFPKTTTPNATPALQELNACRGMPGCDKRLELGNIHRLVSLKTDLYVTITFIEISWFPFR